MKEYPIPDEIAEIHHRLVATRKNRDIYVKLPFGYKKALKLAISYERYITKFWKSVMELYPELDGINVSYLPIKQALIKKEKEDR